MKILVATEPVDARKSYDGLSAMVQSHFGHDILAGHRGVSHSGMRLQQCPPMSRAREPFGGIEVILADFEHE